MSKGNQMLKMAVQVLMMSLVTQKGGWTDRSVSLHRSEVTQKKDPLPVSSVSMATMLKLRLTL